MKSSGHPKTPHKHDDPSQAAAKSHKKHAPRAPDLRPAAPPYRANSRATPAAPDPSSEVGLWAELADRSDPGSSLAGDGEDGRSSIPAPLPLQPLPKDDD